MSAGFAALVAAIGLCGSFLSGLLGIGGAIVIYPMLYHLPPLLGVGQLTAYQVSAATVLQVLASSLSGTVAQRRSPHLNRRVVGVLGGGAAAGGLVGGYASGLLPDAAVHGAYGLLAALAGLTLLLPATDGADGDGDAGRVEPSASSAPVHMPLGALLAFIVGVASGVVGAGGAFLLIPLMLHVLRLPLRVTVTSSLATVFLSSLGGAVG
ncbi:MAG: sulfite exporter TauE/SafE family protein, partial [Clostridia bacterium]|nr:sulfite exporter TauE/SafE family protein [Clostridia bacterium]